MEEVQTQRTVTGQSFEEIQDDEAVLCEAAERGMEGSGILYADAKSGDADRSSAE